MVPTGTPGMKARAARLLAREPAAPQQVLPVRLGGHVTIAFRHTSCTMSIHSVNELSTATAATSRTSPGGISCVAGVSGSGYCKEVAAAERGRQRRELLTIKTKALFEANNEDEPGRANGQVRAERGQLVAADPGQRPQRADTSARSRRTRSGSRPTRNGCRVRGTVASRRRPTRRSGAARRPGPGRGPGNGAAGAAGLNE